MTIPSIEQVIRQDMKALRECPGNKGGAPGSACADCAEEICVMVASVADFPTDYGHFSIIGFVNNRDGKDHVIILKGEVGDGEDLLLRIHSACLTGDAFGSRRCDCGPQLHRALERIEAEGRGAVLYHQAEGRGIGLVNKLRAYALQDGGYDTYDANLALGFKADERDYAIPAAMLKKLGIRSVRLMTNNPEKVDELEKQGIVVRERVQHELPAQTHDRAYLLTKKERFGHLLELDHEGEKSPQS